MVRKLLWAAGGLVGLIVLLLVAGVVIQILAARSDRASMPPPGRRVDVGGLSLHIHCAGEGSPVIVLEPGTASWSTYWLAVQRRLQDHTRVCAYDRAGLGWSDAMAGPRGGATAATHLHDLLQNAGEEPPYLLVGQSYGGWLNMIFHDLWPEEVAGIALVESAHPRQWKEFPPEVTALAENVPAQMKAAGLMARLGLLRLMDLPLPGFPLPEQKEIFGKMLRTPAFYDAAAAEFAAGTTVADEIDPDMSFGDLPLTVVTAGRSVYYYCGEETGIPCEASQEVWDRLQADLATWSTAAVHVVQPQATHDIVVEHHQFVAQAIGGLLCRVDPSSSACPTGARPPDPGDAGGGS